MKTKKGYVACFRCFSKTLTVEQISEKTGLTFDVMNKIGDLRGGSPVLKYEYNICSINSSLNSDVSFDEHFKALLERLKGNEIILKNVGRAIDFQLTGIFYQTDDTTPEIYLSREVIEASAKFGAEIDIDII